MKAICYVTFMIAILVFGLSERSSIIVEEESKPLYSVTMSMNKREIYGSQRVNVEFSILGMGSVSFCSVSVYSDQNNILVNDFWVRYYVVEGDNITASRQFGPVEAEETKGVTAWKSISSIEVPPSTQLFMVGEFAIDTDEISLGSHRLRVVFLAQSNNENYLFEDSIEYRMISYLEEYPLFQYLIPAGISFVVALLVAFLPSYLRERKKRREILKAILNEIRANHEIIQNAEEEEKGKRITPFDFPFSIEIYESLMSEVASIVDADLLSMLQRCYHQTRRLNAANITEPQDKLTPESSPYGWMKFSHLVDYYYIKEKISEVDELLVETMGSLSDKVGVSVSVVKSTEGKQELLSHG